MKLLVTGAGGFIGYHVARTLANANHDVILADNFSRHRRDCAFNELVNAYNVSYHELDLLVGESWADLGGGYDAIFHFAAINGTRHFYQRPYQVIDANVQLMRLMLHWHQTHSPETKIIWTSSSEVYAGVSNLEVPTSEDTPVGIADVFNPRYSYSVSKLAGELLLINYARGADSRYTIVRPHNIYGPRMGKEHVIPEFALRIKHKEEPFKIYGGVETRAFCYISDFVQGIIAILDKPASDGQIINLGDDRHELRILDLAEQMFQITGWHPELDVRPAPAGSVARRKPSLEKARRILNYQPVMELEEGLRATYCWYAKL